MLYQSVMIEDLDHVPMTCMVLEICDKIHKSDFSTPILCGTVYIPLLQGDW